jgi:hypothetical protein
MKVQQIKSVCDKEVNIMNDICGCSFSETEIEDLKLLRDGILVERGIEMIALLPKKELSTIIKIAALLPSPREMKKILTESEKELSLGVEKSFENLHDAVEAIRIAISQMIRGKPYGLPIGTMEALSIVIDKHSVEGREYWTGELLKTLSNDRKLKEQINVWISCFDEIKELIKIFDLSKENIKEMFRKVLKENEELKNAYFWTQHFSNIEDIVKTFDLSEEARKMFEGIIERNKKESPDTCIEIAVKMDIFINPQEFLEIADGLFKKANKGNLRGTYVNTACRTYEELKKNYQFSSRERILEKHENTVLNDRGINKVIRTASKVIGFKYEKQGFWDIHIGR